MKNKKIWTSEMYNWCESIYYKLLLINNLKAHSYILSLTKSIGDFLRSNVKKIIIG